MFSVYDTKVAIFHAPFFCSTRHEAERFMRRAVQELATDYKEFTADYCLFELGEFDNERGVVHAYDAPENLGPLTQYKEPQS